MADFIHLHVHSAYSLSESAIKSTRLKDLCLAASAPAVGVADTNNLFGALEFSETLSGAGVQPLPGYQQSIEVLSLAEAEPNGSRPSHLVLIAQNAEGFRNLMRLTSRSFISSARLDIPCASFDWLADLSEGVVCLSGGYDGPIDRLVRADRSDEAGMLIEQLAKTFPNRFYMELQRHEGRDWSAAEAFTLDNAYRIGLPIVATNEPFFPTADDFEAHDALLCIADGAYVHQDDRRKVTSEHYFKSADEMHALFEDLPEAVSTTFDIARRCAFRPRTHPPILPRFVAQASVEGNDEVRVETLTDAELAEGEANELERQARAGLEARLNVIEAAAPIQDYWSRLERELGIIKQMGFPGYFLIVSDFIKWSKANNIPVGPGRGSGAGSVVAWALTITDLDPLRFGLLFERFLNPERVSMPDFDIDFCQDRRDEVIRYVQEKYGRDRVAQIITFGKLQARAVVRDVGRVLGLPFGQVDRLCKLIPNNPANPVTLAEAIDTEPRLQEERDKEESVATLLSTALKLEGLYRHASTHAAGVVIGDRPLDELTPLYLDPRAEMPATQYNMKWVEPAGLVKFDFLGLKTLTVIEKAAEFVRNSDPALLEFSPERVPTKDEPTFRMLGEGQAVGVFQLESAGMRATLRAMKPDSLEDIIALISLYRPGPMENIPTYVERKKGEAPIDYLHETLQPVLEETYGVIIYQEQVMQIAQILSGYSLGEADLLRRAMGKKKKEEMDKQRIRFVDGAKERGVEPAKASSIFDLVQKFAGYGFNKSHAAAYAYIAYQTAYLKANYPAALLAASMSLDRTNTDKLAIFVKESRDIAVSVMGPHVNHSASDFTVSDGAIFYGLGAIKNVGEVAMDEIAQERKANGSFKDLYDLAERVPLKSVGKRSLENMARAGALDGLAPSRAAALGNVDMILRYSAQVFDDRASSQRGLFDDGPTALERPRFTKVDAETSLEALNNERLALGFYFSGHPLDDYAVELKRLEAMNFAEISAAAQKTRVDADMAVVVRDIRLRRSRNGNPFAWVECSDATGDFEVTVFSETLSKSRDLLESGSLLLLRVGAEARDGDVRFTCESARRLDAAAAQTTSQLRVGVQSEAALAAVKRRLAAVKPPTPQEAGDVFITLHLKKSPGDADIDQRSLMSAAAYDVTEMPCSIEKPDTASLIERCVDLKLPEKALCTPAVRSALKALDGVVDVELI
ncbi:MAG: DNA polymerase III subunit alpha [Pseudomonadota bacterium]